MPGLAPKTLAEHCAGSIVGLADYFGDLRSGTKARFVAAPQGCSALVFSRRGFSELIDVSPIFEQALIRELALQCESLQRRLRMDSEQLGQ